MFYNNFLIVTISIGCFGMILVEHFQQQKGSEGSILPAICWVQYKRW